MFATVRKYGIVICILGLFVLSIGCGSSDNGTTDGGTDTRVSGTWSGNYQTTGSDSGNSNYSGSLTLILVQSGTIIIGTADGSITGVVNGTAVNSSFSGQQVSGGISDRTLDIQILFGAYKVDLHGTVSSDTTSISGNWRGDFSATGDDTADGTWTVLKS